MKVEIKHAFKKSSQYQIMHTDISFMAELSTEGCVCEPAFTQASIENLSMQYNEIDRTHINRSERQ